MREEPRQRPRSFRALWPRLGVALFRHQAPRRDVLRDDGAGLDRVARRARDDRSTARVSSGGGDIAWRRPRSPKYWVLRLGLRRRVGVRVLTLTRSGGL